jgi:predicted HicB family RNase H-like nuclease
MKAMSYKGYLARIEFDARDRVFVGRVLGVKDIIGFHGSSVDEIEREFRTAIDHYLAVCTKRGEKPDKPYSGKLMLRVPPDVHAAAAAAAEASGNSLNQWAAKALSAAAEEQRAA